MSEPTPKLPVKLLFHNVRTGAVTQELSRDAVGSFDRWFRKQLLWAVNNGHSLEIVHERDRALLDFENVNSDNK